jgi:hypothetical protein
MRMAGSIPSIFGADDAPNVVASAGSAGEHYRFSAWVRSDSSRSPVRLRVYEFLDGVQLGPVTLSHEVPASTTWQLVTVDHQALAAGSTLSLRITLSPTAAGERFLVDDVSIQRLPAGALLVAGAPGDGAEDDEAGDESPSVETPDGTLAFAASFSPNPMRGEGTLSFTLPVAGAVRVDLFDPAGRRLRTLVNEPAARAGRHAVPVRSRGSEIAPGVYFYRVDAPGVGVRTGRVVVLE